MSGMMPQPLRSDAQERRDRILEAARELFAQSGLTVTMRQIARRAHVGPATLYRRFPTKQALVLDAMRDELASCRSIVVAAAADPDPWRGFCSAVEGLLTLHARNQGFTDAFFSAFPDAFDVASHRVEVVHELSTVAQRAKAAGSLRADFVMDDLLLVLLAGRGLTMTPAAVRTEAARRLAGIAIEGFRASGGNTTLPPRVRLASTVSGDRA